MHNKHINICTVVHIMYNERGSEPGAFSGEIKAIPKKEFIKDNDPFYKFKIMKLPKLSNNAQSMFVDLMNLGCITKSLKINFTEVKNKWKPRTFAKYRGELKKGNVILREENTHNWYINPNIVTQSTGMPIKIKKMFEEKECGKLKS